MGVLEKAIQAIWGKEIERQLQIPFDFSPPPLQNNYDTCVHCLKRYGLMDFHDCKGEFDAYRIYIGAATNSVWERYARTTRINGANRDALRDHGRSEIENLPMAEFNDLADRYTKKVKGLDNPDLDLEEDLWNS